MSEDAFWKDDDDDWGEELQWTPHSSSASAGDTTSRGHADDAEAPIHTGAQHVILLIDCHADMFVPPDDPAGDHSTTNTHNTTKTKTTTSSSHGHNNSSSNNNITGAPPIHLALQLCQQLLQERIQDTVKLKVGKRNGVGVLLYDTKPIASRSNTTTTSTNTSGAQSTPNRDTNGQHAPSDDEEDDEEEEDGEDGTTPRQVHVLMDLHPPGITQVQTIRACLKGDRNVYKEFASTPTTTSSSRFLPLQTALEESIRMFRHASCVRKADPKNKDIRDTKSIWIVTNRPEPYQDYFLHPGGANNNDRDDVRRRMETVAHDCHEMEIQIIVWPLVQSSTTTYTDNAVFDMSSFYQGIVSHDVFQGRRIGTIEDLCHGLDQMQSYWKKIRKLYWGPLFLPGQQQQQQQPETTKAADDSNDDGHGQQPNVMMVDWFRLVQPAKKPNKVQIDQHTKRETIKVKQYLDHNLEIMATIPLGTTGSDKAVQTGLGRLRQFATLGGEDVLMSSHDMSTIRDRSNGGGTITGGPNQPGLRLLGFKPTHEIPWYHSMNPAYLIYPSDTVVKGSRDAFTELRRAMIRKQVVGIGEVLHRIHWSSRLVALVPMPDFEDNLEDVEAVPQGIMVTTLPFEDDIRILQEDEAYQEWRAQQSMKHQSESLSIKMDETPDEIPSDITTTTILPSPELVQAATNLITRHGLVDMRLGDDFDNAALTEFYTYLEQVALELPVDESQGAMYDTRPDESKIAQILGDCINDFRKHLPDDLELPKKGRLATAGGSGSLKRKKEAPPDESGVDWQDLYLSDELDTVKVPQLKSFLRSHGAPLSGNKSTLVSRVTHLVKASMTTSIGTTTRGDTKVKLEV